MSLGLLIWGGGNLVTGWAVGYFGLFGVAPEKDLKVLWLNYVGISLALMSLAVFFFIRTEVSGPEDDEDEEEWWKRRQTWLHNHPLLGSRRFRSFPANLNLYQHDCSDPYVNEVVVDPTALASPALQTPYRGIEEESVSSEKEDEVFWMKWLEELPPRQKRLTGCTMAIISGFFYGINFVPSQDLMDTGQGSEFGLDYAFSQFCGIFLTSIVYVLLYSAFRRNRPIVNAQAVLPAFGSGLLWAIGQLSWFFANDVISVLS